MLFKRKLYGEMLKWKKTDGASALLIKGARRVGKSTLAEDFAKNEYDSYILIDFSAAPPAVHELFRDLSDLNYLFMRLQLIYNVTLYKRRSVIIFDEVQKQPLARQAIKHLVKDGRYDYIETGSLLSIRKNIKDIVIPSEETRLSLYPMDYEEFCNAVGDETTVPLLSEAYEKKLPLGDSVNAQMMRKFRLYMLVGGMPQAVKEYIAANNLASVDMVKRKIIELYEEDFRKTDPSGRAGMLFDAIPSELAKNASRYQISSVIEGERESRMSEVIADMQDSMTVNIAWHADSPSAGMALSRDSRRYKLYVCDTGLFTTLAFKDRAFTENVIYEKLLSNKLNSNLGYLYENVAAQTLRASGNELYYYTFPRDNSNKNYEIDFIVVRKNKICPLEIKSSGYKTHASLDAFCSKFSAFTSDSYLVYTKDLKKERAVTCLPIYMLQFL